MLLRSSATWVEEGHMSESDLLSSRSVELDLEGCPTRQSAFSSISLHIWPDTNKEFLIRLAIVRDNLMTLGDRKEKKY